MKYESSKVCNFPGNLLRREPMAERPESTVFQLTHLISLADYLSKEFAKVETSLIP